jgi:hypothetical protein
MVSTGAAKDQYRMWFEHPAWWKRIFGSDARGTDAATKYGPPARWSKRSLGLGARKDQLFFALVRAGSRDFIMSGTPAGPGPVVRRDVLEGHVDGSEDFRAQIVRPRHFSREHYRLMFQAVDYGRRGALRTSMHVLRPDAEAREKFNGFATLACTELARPIPLYG